MLAWNDFIFLTIIYITYTNIIFIYDVSYNINIYYHVTEVNEPHEGLRKNESQWPIHRKSYLM